MSARASVPHDADVEQRLLSVRGLRAEFKARGTATVACDGIDLELDRQQVVGIAGESGSGKSTLATAIAGLLRPPGTVSAGQVLLDGRDLLTLSKRQLRAVRGKRIGFVFQDPLNALNPCQTVGTQIDEVFRLHARDARERHSGHVKALLDRVGLPERRIHSYPHELSGGMRQRVTIAIAIAIAPELLIADEPTTALDVTIQSQILDLLGDLVAETRAGMLIVSHDIGVLARLASTIVVMYKGRIAETGPADRLIAAPQHPYSAALLAAIPRVHGPRVRLRGPLEYVRRPAAGTDRCLFCERCPYAVERCHTEAPALRTVESRQVACHRAPEIASRFAEDASAEIPGSDDAPA